MEKLVVYCHGYNSSANTDKVKILKDAGFSVYAWDINVDPTISMPELESNIDSILLDRLNRELELVFVGTSLGAWYASRLAEKYGARAVLVNPAYNPATLLPTIGLDEKIAAKYSPIIINNNDDLIVAKDDELIDHCRDWPDAKSVTISETGGHRFNGKEFQIVVDMI